MGENCAEEKKKRELLKKWIQESRNVVFFGGAGVSTESGIPDFRSVDGLYNQEYDYPPETILSHTFYLRKTEEFYRFYRNKMLFPEVKPNRAHLALARLEQEGKVRAVITQNIDGLHQAAGSREVLELHGSVHRNYCERCGRFYSMEHILSCEGVPKCSCGGVIKPDVVLYEEGLDDSVLSRSIEHIRNADVLIIGGTSLTVYPAAGLIDYYRGNKLVLINKSATSRDSQADLVICGGSRTVNNQIRDVLSVENRETQDMTYEVGDIVKLKKPHPCGSREWEILRVGADFRLKCTGCGHQVMMARPLVEKSTRGLRSADGEKKA